MTAVLTSVDGSIFLITLNRPAKRNAWNQDLVDGLTQAWVDFESSEAMVCVVKAEGPSFSAGLDLQASLKSSDDGALPNLAVPCNKPIIVATEGACLGMACSFVLMCDMVVYGEGAFFAYLEPKMGVYGGLMAGFAGRFLYRPGLQWMMTGERMGAQRAYEIGMINEVVPDGMAFERALAIAKQISENAPLVIQSMKSLAMKTLPMGPAEVHYRDLCMLDAIRKSDDYIEGVAALRERRPAKFKGR